MEAHISGDITKPLLLHTSMSKPKAIVASVLQVRGKTKRGHETKGKGHSRSDIDMSLSSKSADEPVLINEALLGGYTTCDAPPTLDKKFIGRKLSFKFKYGCLV